MTEEWRQSCEEQLLHTAQLSPLCLQAMHKEKSDSAGERMLQESMGQCDNNLKTVMALDERVNTVSKKTSEVQTHERARAQEAALLWEQVKGGGASCAKASLEQGPTVESGGAVQLEELASLRKDLLREQWLDRLLAQVTREYVLRSGVDWSQDPEWIALITGVEPAPPEEVPSASKGVYRRQPA